jgi:hypothetical protein
MIALDIGEAPEARCLSQLPCPAFGRVSVAKARTAIRVLCTVGLDEPTAAGPAGTTADLAVCISQEGTRSPPSL